MPGICLDTLNPVGHPTTRRLNRIHANTTRIELRDCVEYRGYVYSLHRAGIHVVPLIGPSTEPSALSSSLASILFDPNIVIIGNEPDGQGDSSWSMSTDEYVEFWNQQTRAIRTLYPTTRLCAAGMVGMPHYLSVCWPNLNPKPDYVNKHYPNSESELQEYKEIFNRPVIVGEWCWKTATQDEMTEWVAMLSNNCLEHFWFCWSDGMVDGMGLTNKQDRPTTAYRRYKKAIETVSK